MLLEGNCKGNQEQVKKIHRFLPGKLGWGSYGVGKLVEKVKNFPEPSFQIFRSEGCWNFREQMMILSPEKINF